MRAGDHVITTKDTYTAPKGTKGVVEKDEYSFWDGDCYVVHFENGKTARCKADEVAKLN